MAKHNVTRVVAGMALALFASACGAATTQQATAREASSAAMAMQSHAGDEVVRPMTDNQGSYAMQSRDAAPSAQGENQGSYAMQSRQAQSF